MKFEVIDTVPVLYDKIAVHLNYYTIYIILITCKRIVPHEI